MGVSGGVGDIAAVLSWPVWPLGCVWSGGPRIDERRRLRTLSCTRERRDGRSSSRMPDSSALLSGSGLCIVVDKEGCSTAVLPIQSRFVALFSDRERMRLDR